MRRERGGTTDTNVPGCNQTPVVTVTLAQIRAVSKYTACQTGRLPGLYALGARRIHNRRMIIHTGSNVATLFDEKVQIYCHRQKTNWQDAIDPEQRLSVCSQLTVGQPGAAGSCSIGFHVRKMLSVN